MDPLAYRVAQRWAFKFEHKETKQNRVERLWRSLREATGISRGLSEAIADALVRGRNLATLAYQKKGSLEGMILQGPSGTVDLRDLS